MEPLKVAIQCDRFVKLEGVLQNFCINTCFTYNDSFEEIKCLEVIFQYLLTQGSSIAVYGNNRLIDYFFKHTELAKSVNCILVDACLDDNYHELNIPLINLDRIPQEIEVVFLCEPTTFLRWQAEKRIKKINSKIKIISPEILPKLDYRVIPTRGWIDRYDSIYPINVPEISFKDNQDLILLTLPFRDEINCPLGLGYVHEALKRANIIFQTFDLNIVFYHRYHITRLFDHHNATITLPSGKSFPDNPWRTEKSSISTDNDFIKFFDSWMDEFVSKIVKAKPKILALSIHRRNLDFSRIAVKKIKRFLPEISILVGGYNYQIFNIGFEDFPEADYIAIGEVDFSIGSFVKKLLSEQNLKNMPGFKTKHDSSDWEFIPSPLPQPLDMLSFPKYEWFGIDIYHEWDHTFLIPILFTRGCRWGRCRFCVEGKIKFRGRSVKCVVDELEWLSNQGCVAIFGSESDVNANQETLLQICDEIISRNIHVSLVAQLRIDKRNTFEFFSRLHQAGFYQLVFGVDAWSKNTLLLQDKGYLKATITQNLRDCRQAGIITSVNVLFGVPGETEDDIDESISFIIENKPYIDIIATINVLLLTANSPYWCEPEKYNIHFAGDKKALYKEYPREIPKTLWYSEEPLIDREVLAKRYKKIVSTLQKNGFDVDGLMLSEDEGETIPDSAEAMLQQEKNIYFQLHDNFYKVRTDCVAGFAKIKLQIAIFLIKIHNHINILAKHPQEVTELKNKFICFVARLFCLAKLIRSFTTNFYTYNMVLFKDDYFGYDLYKTYGQFLALKLGYPVDGEKIKNNDYPEKVLLKSINLRGLVDKIHNPKNGGWPAGDSAIS